MAKSHKEKYGFDHTTGDGQKRLMAVASGLPQEIYIERPTLPTMEDYGADPLGDGTFRMVPSGDIVSYEERTKRLSKDQLIYVKENGEVWE